MNQNLSQNDGDFDIDNGDDWANFDSNGKKNFRSLQDPVNLNQNHHNNGADDFEIDNGDDWDFGRQITDALHEVHQDN